MNNTNTFRYIFLDRDGVINVERPSDYVKNTAELVFIEGALEAIALLTQKAEKLFIVTNQRGVGRGLMSIKDLDAIHQYMLSEIEKKGGHISKIYTCTSINSEDINRKPNIGMAFQAKRDYPEIEFSESVMVGNSSSDIEFGNRLGMYTVLVGDKYPQDHIIYSKINSNYDNLYKFAEHFDNTINHSL